MKYIFNNEKKNNHEESQKSYISQTMTNMHLNL